MGSDILLAITILWIFVDLIDYRILVEITVITIKAFSGKTTYWWILLGNIEKWWFWIDLLLLLLLLLLLINITNSLNIPSCAVTVALDAVEILA